MEFKPQYLLFRKKIKASFVAQKFMKFINAQIVTINPGYCEIHLPYKEELTQQNGYFHAGIVGTLADNAGGYAAFSLMPEKSEILTVEYKINFVSPCVGDKLIARGSVIKPGRKLTICNTTVHSCKLNIEKLSALSQMTLICVE